MQSGQKLVTILLNKHPWKWFMFKILLRKVVLLIKYSDEKIIFRKIQLSSGLQNWLWKLKMSNFWWSSIKMPYKIIKKPFRRLIQTQKSIEFQLYHWEIPQLSPYYCLSSKMTGAIWCFWKPFGVKRCIHGVPASTLAFWTKGRMFKSVVGKPATTHGESCASYTISLHHLERTFE